MAASIRQLAIATPLVAIAFLAACSGEAASPGDTNTPVETPTSPAATATAGLTAGPTLPSAEDREGLQALIDELNAASKRDRQENPRFTGLLGDFLVVPDFVSAGAPCQTVDVVVPSPDAELFFTLPNGDTPKTAYICADGTVTWVCCPSAGSGVVVQRYYFTKARPGVFLNSPLERISLMSIAGRPAVITRPLPELEPWPFAATRELAVVERFPTDGAPGILLYLTGTGSHDEFVETARYVVEQAGG